MTIPATKRTIKKESKKMWAGVFLVYSALLTIQNFELIDNVDIGRHAWVDVLESSYTKAYTIRFFRSSCS